MRLEKIVLNGFKSFADKTEFCFDPGITAVVGPNGCGKSNIVDAMKWVLGEQSVKSLRSGQMADVIFGGSGARKPLGRAEVVLCFVDIDGQLSIGGQQLEVTRRLYRSGESEYLINNKTCRLKDIRELFMDTGIGTKAYSVIEQGQVEQLLHASKADRRIIFEEAAGISKYKAHKREALRKLERTEQNLLRLADILSEVHKQLRSVKLQAGKARSYLKYSQRLKELRVNYSLAEFDKINTQSRDRKTALTQLEDILGGMVAQVAGSESLLSQLSDEVIQTENQINRSDNSLVATTGKIEQHLDRIKFLGKRSEELQERKQKACEEIQKLQEQVNRFAEALEKCQSELKAGQQVIEQKSRESGQLEKIIDSVSMQCASLESELEDEKSGIIDIVRRTAQLHNEIQSISTYRHSLSGQKERLSGRARVAKAELEGLLAQEAQYRARDGDIEKVLTDSQQTLETERKKIEAISSELAVQREKLARSKEMRSALQRELTLLADMENRREGLNNAVKNILGSQSEKQNKPDYVQAILADIIKADVEYADAVEAALEGRTDAVVINKVGRLLKDKQRLEELEARVKFISAEMSEPFVDSLDLSKYPLILGRIVEFVNFEAKYAPFVWGLLGRTLVVRSIQAAAELANRIGSEYRFVTLKGEVLEAKNSVRAGPLGKSTGLISRKSRLRELEANLADINAEIAVLEKDIERNVRQNEHLSRLCKDMRTAVYEANTEKTEVTSKLGLIRQNIKRLTTEQPLISGEIDVLAEQIAQSVQKEYDSKQKLQELEAVSTQRNQRVQELRDKLVDGKKKSELKKAELTEVRVSLGQVGEKIKAIRDTISTLNGQKRQAEEGLVSAGSEVTNCGAGIEQSRRDILSCESIVSELFVQKEKEAKLSTTLREKVEELLAQRNQTEQFVRQKRTEQAELEEQIHQVKLELSQLEVREADLVQRVQEELQIDLRQAYGNYEKASIDWEEVRAEIGELREKIDRLGNVNLDSISQQEELQKRDEFLSGQVEDLNKSKRQLEQLIKRINRESRERFRITFEQIRVNFQELFRKLFGGGRADIILEEPEDILESGLEIIARPPGKETRSISLLSGGEKAMTAIALLFSIFKTKPSPFCFLDEVDAALDEANNERFNLILREFEKDSQFIVITHSKRTISIADVLFGITMQTQGVSKKIGVKFDRSEPLQPDSSAAVA